MSGAACPCGGIHEARRAIVSCADRRRPRRRSGRGAEADLHAQLGRGRRPRAVFLCAEDGLVQTGRHRHRFRDRTRLGGVGPEGRRGRLAARPLRHGGRAAVPRQGSRPRRADERLRQFAAGPLLAQEQRHQQPEGPRRQEDRQSGGRRRAHDVARARQGERHRPELGHLGEHRRQRQARRAEGEDRGRHDVVLQPAPRVRARARRRHGLRRLEGRRHQSVRQFDHRERRVAEGQHATRPRSS